MKKIIMIAAMAVMSFAAMAQDFKFGYVDFNVLVMLMPEMDEARAAIEENQKTNEEILMTMYQEYETKMQQYQQNNATWTPAVREMKEKEIMQKNIFTDWRNGVKHSIPISATCRMQCLTKYP